MNRRILIPAVLGLICFAALIGDAAPANTTTITSKQLEYDYKRLIAEFKGDVVVIDPQIIIESDNLTVIFTASNEVRSVTAVGNVRIKQGGKTSTSNKAIYITREGKLMLIGNVKLVREGDSITGNEVTYWFNDDRMICKPATLIMTSDERKDKGGKEILPGLGTKSNGQSRKQQ